MKTQIIIIINKEQRNSKITQKKSEKKRTYIKEVEGWKSRTWAYAGHLDTNYEFVSMQKSPRPYTG